MPDEIQARSRLIAHYEDMIERIQRRIDTLRNDTTGTEWTRVTAGTIARYEDEIETSRKKLAYYQELAPRPRPRLV